MQKSKIQKTAEYYRRKFLDAQKLQQTGHLAKAEKAYEELLRDIPNNPDCIHFLGLLFFQKGELDKAEAKFKKSIQLVKNPTYLTNYALLVSHKKNHKKAIELLLESIKLKPDNTEAWYNLGCIYNEIGDLSNSEDAYQRVIHYNKKHIKALFNLLCVQESLNKTEDAKKTINMIMAFKPISPEQYYSLAIAISRLNIQDNTKLAIDYLHKAISENPNSIEAYRALATLHVEWNSIEKAKEIYEEVIKKEPNIQLLNLEYANCLLKAGETGKAIEIFSRVFKNDKTNLAALNGLANGYRLDGNFAEAIRIFTDVIKKDENNIQAYTGLSNCEKFTKNKNKFIVKMDNLIETKPDTAGYFALGKIHDDLKLYDKAIEYYHKGNNLKNKKLRFDKKQHIKKINSIINIFNKEYINHLQISANLSEQPIFVLGAPRSGTTLVEQIISSHSKVFGAGELSYIRHIATGKYIDSVKIAAYPERFKNDQDKNTSFVSEDAKIYLDKTMQFIDDDKIIRVTDKMPANYQYLGYIFSMFPNSKVINTQRDPIDTCLSIYFQNFHSGHEYAFNLDNLVAWYKEYIRLMDHWRQIFGEKILTVDYNNMINDTEKTVRDVINYCNLEWENECLLFYNSKRTINTASNWQANQPIYKSSKQRWKNYEKFIPEIIEGLSALSGKI